MMTKLESLEYLKHFKGSQLDNAGHMVGMSRGKLKDEEYRKKLELKLKANGDCEYGSSEYIRRSILKVRGVIYANIYVNELNFATGNLPAKSFEVEVFVKQEYPLWIHSLVDFIGRFYPFPSLNRRIAVMINQVRPMGIWAVGKTTMKIDGYPIGFTKTFIKGE